MKRSILLSLALLFAMHTFAQVSISGEIRPRSEFRNGFKRLIDDTKKPAFFTEQRSRLYFDYQSPKYKLRIAFQDIRIWGQTSQTFKTDNSMTSISEAWAQYYFTPKWSLKLGRQMLSYDNQRFLGGLEWAQQGRRHDAALLMHENAEKKFTLHIGGAFNQDATVLEPSKLFNTTYTALNNYKAMQFVWAHKDFATAAVSGLLFNESSQYGSTPDSVSFRQTMGAVGSKTWGNMVLAGEGYLQTGEYKGKKVSAYLLDLNLTYKGKKMPVTVGYQLLSGTKAGSTKIGAFDPAYGTNHIFNGLMDYFYVGSGHANVGLQDVYVKTTAKIGKKGSLAAEVHQFFSAEEVMEAGKAVSKSFGTEIDLVYQVKFAEEVTFNLGYSQMFATHTMELVKGGNRKNIQNWAWAMITFKPNFYKKTEPATAQ